MNLDTFLPAVEGNAASTMALKAYSSYVPAHPATDGATPKLLGMLSSRQNTSPRRLEAPAPNSKQLEQIFSAAAAAPDHGLLNPWRFISIGPDQRPALAKAFVLALLERDPGATQEQLEAAGDKAARAPFLALAVFRPDANPTGIRPIEQTISLGCAIQNVLLAAHALGFGSGLSSGRAMTSRALRALFNLTVNEEAVCFVAIGSVTKHKPGRMRPTIGTFLSALSA
ncbi:MAG: nitroreductase [Polaromonas sp.]